MTQVLVDDWIAAFAVVAPEPIRVVGIADAELCMTYTMWLRVTTAIAKVRANPEANRGNFSRLFEGRHDLARRPDPDRLRILNPAEMTWEVARAKVRAGVGNILRAEWLATSEEFDAVCLSNGQRSLGALTPRAHIGDPALAADDRFELLRD